MNDSHGAVREGAHKDRGAAAVAMGGDCFARHGLTRGAGWACYGARAVGVELGRDATAYSQHQLGFMVKRGKTDDPALSRPNARVVASDIARES